MASRINKIIRDLREAAHTGFDVDARWQNLVDEHTVRGCAPEVTFYVRDHFERYCRGLSLDWICAQWLELPPDRWEAQFARERAEKTSWRYVVKMRGDDFQSSYYIQKYGEHNPETKMPRTGISWLESCALANKKSLEAGLEPVYYFNETKEPLVSLGSWDGKLMFEDQQANGVRIPTREEWMNACLAGRKGQDTPWGNHCNFEDSFKALDKYVVCHENSKGQMAPVGTKLPNQWDLYDMLGNFFEFTSEEVNGS